MTKLSLPLALAFTAAIASPAFAAPKPAPQPVTIVLVHGAFADGSSWNGVVARLKADGYTVVAAANPLRSVQTDADSVGATVKSIKGPVVLVGHSYGGDVISNPSATPANVKALVYVAAFAPEEGENALGLTGRFPGSTLGQALAPAVDLADGSHDLYIDQAKFPAQFAADVPLKDAQLMAAEQRPVRDAALNEPATAPSWKHLPSWFVYGSADKNIPPAAMAFMADRAGAKKTTVIAGASHVLMISHPKEVAEVIEAAAKN